MGSQQCVECQQPKQQNHAYGDYELINQNTRIYAVVEKKVEKDPILEAKVITQLEQRKKIHNPHIVKLYKYDLQHQEYGFKVTMFYEYVPKTLRQRIEELKFKKMPFSQRQLFSLIYGVQMALQQLHSNEIKHCCINLDTIVCRNNFYKLTDVSSTTYVTSYDLVKKGSKQQFLSEKLLENYSHQALDPSYDLKDDLFSLGMIALMVGSQKQNCFYRWEEQCNGVQLNLKEIEKALREIQRYYSGKLVKKIKSLLGEEEKSEVSNLTDTLHELDEEMNRVLSKYNRQNGSSISTHAQSQSQSFRF